jgi:hypothetical protein
MQTFILRTPEGEPITVHGTPTFNFDTGSEFGNFPVTAENTRFINHFACPNITHIQFSPEEGPPFALFPDQLGEEKIDKLLKFGIQQVNIWEEPAESVKVWFDTYRKGRDGIDGYFPEEEFWNLEIPEELLAGPDGDPNDAVSKFFNGAGSLVITLAVAVDVLRSAVKKKDEPSFPLNGAGGLGGDVVDNSVDASDFVDDPSRNPPKDITG